MSLVRLMAYNSHASWQGSCRSSSINGLIFNRGQKMDFDVWAQMGNRGWSYDDVLPYFCRYTHENSVDENLKSRNDHHQPSWRNPLCDAFIKGAESIGIPRNPDYNGAYQEGTSYVQRTSTGKLRMSAARAFSSAQTEKSSRNH